MVLNQWWFCFLRNTWQCLKTLRTFQVLLLNLGRGLFWYLEGRNHRCLLTSYNAPDSPHKKSLICPQMSIVLGLRNPKLDTEYLQKFHKQTRDCRNRPDLLLGKMLWCPVISLTENIPQKHKPNWSSQVWFSSHSSLCSPHISLSQITSSDFQKSAFICWPKAQNNPKNETFIQ